MGCDGNGRGPPGVWRGVELGYAGRGGAGRGGCGACGRTAVAPGWAVTPGAGRAGGGTAGRSTRGALGRGTILGPDPLVGSGAVGVVGGCSSMRRRMVGGTTRPGVGSLTAGGSGGAGREGLAGSTAGSTSATGVASTRISGCGAGGGSAGSASGAAGSTATDSVDSAIGDSTWGAGGAALGTGLTVFTKRGGGRAGATGLGGSGAFFATVGFFHLATGASAKMSPVGKAMPRCLARRSTNCRATTSSIVLDALLRSIPWSRLSSAVTSWLVVPRSSATL